VDVARGSALQRLGAGEGQALGRHVTELPGAVEALGVAKALGGAVLGAALEAGALEAGALALAEPVGAAEPLGAGEVAGVAVAGGADGADGAADAQAIGLADGATEAEGMVVGAGVGRRPTGSGPTKTSAARMPTATRTPTSRPASSVTPVFIAAEGTSTDGRGRDARSRC